MPVRPSTSSAPPEGLVGRQDVLDHLRSVVERPGIVTVTGPGGVGKTRVVRALLDALPRTLSTTIVELDYAAAPAGVVDLAARALVGEAYSASDPMAAVAGVVRDDDHVLVLDGVAPDVHDPLDIVALRDACPRLRVVVTSLRRLGVSGEQLVDVAPLALPSADDPWRSPAMLLLADHLARAGRAVDPGNTDDTAALGEICRRAGGVPLALELVAGWAPVYAPADIAALVGSSLDLFSGGGPDRPERQRDLRALIELSLRHLTDEQRTVLATVAAVPGGIDHALLTELCGTGVLLAVRALVERHLVIGAVTAGRFDVLEPVRLFVEQELASAFDAARAQLAERVVADVLHHGPLVGTASTTDAVRRLVALEALHRPTIARLSATGDRCAIDLVEELTAFWLATARLREGEDAVDVARPAALTEVDRTRLAIVRATLLNHRHDLTAAGEAERGLAGALAVTGPERVLLEARARLALTRARWISGDEEAALAVLTTWEPDATLAPVLHRRLALELAVVHHNAGNEEAAEQALTDARTIAGGDDDLRTLLDAAGLQLAVRGPGNGIERRHIDEALALLARCDWPFLEHSRLRCWVALRQIGIGDLDGATRTLEPALHHAERTGSSLVLQTTLLAHAALRAEVGEADAARRTMVRAIDLAIEHAGPVPASSMLDFAVNLASPLGIVGDDLRTLLVGTLPLVQAGDHGLLGTVRPTAIVDAIRACGLDDDEVARLRAAPVSRAEVVERLRWLRTVLSREGGYDRRRVDPRLAELSARELEILQLVALGKTDQDIADELVVGLRTVNTHVANIRRKLGAPNRRAAAAVYRDAAG